MSSVVGEVQGTTTVCAVRGSYDGYGREVMVVINLALRGYYGGYGIVEHGNESKAVKTAEEA